MEIADNLVISIIFSDSQIILELFLNKLFGAFMDFNYLFLLSQYLFRNNSITYDLQKVYGSEFLHTIVVSFLMFPVVF